MSTMCILGKKTTNTFCSTEAIYSSSRPKQAWNQSPTTDLDSSS